jgi:hypothetical protein
VLASLFAACNNNPRPPNDADPDAPITGKVLERLDSTPYTYLRLKTPQGELWAALPASDLRIGKTVTITNGAVIENFEVKPLGRKLDKVVFGTLAAE